MRWRGGVRLSSHSVKYWSSTLFHEHINTFLRDAKTDICLFPLLAFIPPSLSDRRVDMEQWLTDDGERYITHYTVN